MRVFSLFLILLLLRVESGDDEESSDGSDSGSKSALDPCETDYDRVGTSIVSGRLNRMMTMNRLMDQIPGLSLLFICVKQIMIESEHL